MLGISVCIIIAAPVFAESAPVYDADACSKTSSMMVHLISLNTCHRRHRRGQEEEVLLFRYNLLFICSVRAAVECRAASAAR